MAHSTFHLTWNREMDVVGCSSICYITETTTKKSPLKTHEATHAVSNSIHQFAFTAARTNITRVHSHASPTLVVGRMHGQLPSTTFKG